jgi:phosphohistidine swiveling domain-containing protein
MTLTRSTDGEGQPVQDPSRWADEPGLPGAPDPRPHHDGLDHVAPLRPTDLSRSWLLDFHHPRGVVPLAISLVDDIGTASQEAALALGLGLGGGFASRLVGPHVYLGPCPSPPASETARRAAEAELDGYPDRFGSEWADHVSELGSAYAALDATDLDGTDRAGLATYLAAAHRLHRRAWQIHFHVMYRVFAVQHRFLVECRELGLTDVDAASLLQGDDNAILASDRALDGLAASARAAGLADAMLSAPPGGVAPALRGNPDAAGWLAELDGVLAQHGDRADALSDLTAPSWREDPEIPLGLVRSALEAGSPRRHVPAAERLAMVHSRLSPAARTRLDVALDVALRANAVWWNEEHNAWIDLRVHLPVRRGALALATAVGTPQPDDGLLLLRTEVAELLHGSTSWAALAERVAARREYLARWAGRRAQLPARLGSGEAGADPVLDEILGASQPASERGGSVLHGLGVSSGVARGRARVLRTADRLPDVRAGEVLVCEATSPSWTPVFERLAACVCDSGGMLTHAAIIAREYAVPCVCAVGDATQAIADGDLVEVDGSEGTVRILARASDG